MSPIEKELEHTPKEPAPELLTEAVRIFEGGEMK